MPASSPIPARPAVAQGLFSYQIGGSERVGADVARTVAQRGYRSLCFAFYDSAGPIRDELEAAGVECFDLNFERGRRLTRRLTYQLSMYRWLRDHQVCALHVHHATALILAGLPAKAAGVKRIVMTEHALHQLRDKPWYRRESRLYCRLADAITVVHPALSDYFLETMWTPPERLHYVPNGVRITGRDATVRERLRAKLGVKSDQMAFLFAGRLHETKDLPTLLRAYEVFHSRAPGPSVLWLAGDGAERSELEGLAASLGLGTHVNFLGARSDIRDLMSAADTFVMSSATEGLPMVLLEAMATGLPCIATAVGGIPQLLDTCGRVVEPHQPDALAAAMIDLATDPALRAALAAAAFERALRDNDLENVVDAYLGLLGLPLRWADPSSGS